MAELPGPFATSNLSESEYAAQLVAYRQETSRTIGVSLDELHAMGSIAVQQMLESIPEQRQLVSELV